MSLNVTAVAVDPNFTFVAKSWQEQRRYTHVAIEALDNHPVVANITDELVKISPQWPDLKGE